MAKLVLDLRSNKFGRSLFRCYILGSTSYLRFIVLDGNRFKGTVPCPLLYDNVWGFVCDCVVASQLLAPTLSKLASACYSKEDEEDVMLVEVTCCRLLICYNNKIRSVISQAGSEESGCGRPKCLAPNRFVGHQ